MSELSYPFDVVALGELLIDFACLSIDDSGYPTLTAQPGGAPSNCLATLQQFGHTTALIGKVGADAFGQLLLTTLQARGIETRGVLSDPGVFTTLAFVTLDATGNRTFSFARKPGADTQLTAEEVDLSLIENAKVLHFGSLSLTDEPARTATQQAVRHAKSAGRWISFDPNLRKPLWSNEDAARSQIEWGLHQADIIKISDEEVAFLWGLSPAEGAHKLLSEYGARLVYVTLGPRGCYAANRLGGEEVPCPTGIKVVDTTGAGDIFGGSAMSQLLRLGKAPEALSLSELRDITRFACFAASLSTEKRGGLDSIPEEKAVLALLQSVR